MFEVYFCYLDGVLLYIGEGSRGRHKHCNSGASHVYGLNKLHFEGKVFDVVVQQVGSKEEGVKRETELIRLYKPPFNKKGSCENSKSASIARAKLKKEFIEIVDNSSWADIRKSKLKNLLEEFMMFHKHEEIKDGVIKFESHHRYGIAKLKSLDLCVKSLKYSNTRQDSMVNTFVKYLREAYCKAYNTSDVEIIV